MKNKLSDNYIEDIKRGYVQTDSGYTCLICKKQFPKNEIFAVGERFFNSEEKIQHHIANDHNGMVDFILSLDKKHTGISPSHKTFIEKSLTGITDKEIASELGVSDSAVRFNRYSLKEKAKQARMYLALYALIETGISSDKTTEDEKLIHDTANQVDERYFTTYAEVNKVIKYNLESREPLKIKTFPAKEKKKIIILRMVIESFEKDLRYTEKEVNEILSAMYFDHVSLRRYLIEYGFMSRTKNCSVYWVN